MAVDQGNVSKILSVLSHPLRREILLDLSNNGESSFTDLLNLLKVDTGKLSFHLRSLSPFIEQTPSGKYKLSRAGESAVRVIHDVEGWAEVADVEGKASHFRLLLLEIGLLLSLIDFALILAITAAITIIPELLSLSIARILIQQHQHLFFITIGLLWLYSTLLEGFNGQSIGKRVIGLKVVRTDGKKMSYDHAAVRNFGKVLPLLPFDLLIGWRIKNTAFMRYFDKFAGTTVIDLRSHRHKTANPKTPPAVKPQFFNLTTPEHCENITQRSTEKIVSYIIIPKYSTQQYILCRKIFKKKQPILRLPNFFKTILAKTGANKLNYKEPIIIEHLAFLSVKQNVYLSELYRALVSARATGNSHAES